MWPSIEYTLSNTMILGTSRGTPAEQLFEMLDVVMAEDVLLAAAPPDALDHRGMVRLVGEHHQPRHQPLERRQRRIVGDIGGCEQQRRLLAVQLGEFGLELDVIMGGAGNVAGAARARADLLDRLMHGGAHGRVLAHAEIVVGAPHRHVADAFVREMIGRGIGPAAALEVGENPVAAFGVQRLKMLAEAELVIHVLGLDHLNLNRPLPRPGALDIVAGAQNGKLQSRSLLNAAATAGVHGLTSINRNPVTSAANPWRSGLFAAGADAHE